VKYTVQFRPRVAKQLKAMPKSVRRTIVQMIDALAENPRPSGAVQLKGTDFMRVRVRDYRVI
jgi:mRNA interferase RelE/StbE